jgi:hypothetical protein
MQKLIEIAKATRYKKYEDILDTKEKLWKSKKSAGWQEIMKPGGSGRVGLDDIRRSFMSHPTQAAPQPMTAPAPTAASAAPAPAPAATGLTPEEQAEYDALQKKYGGGQ